MTQATNWEEEQKFPVAGSSCYQAARLIHLSVERRLTLREWLTMRIHLLSCKTCGFYRRQMLALRKIFIRNEEVLDKIPPSSEERLPEQSKERMCRIILEKK